MLGTLPSLRELGQPVPSCPHLGCWLSLEVSSWGMGVFEGSGGCQPVPGIDCTHSFTGQDLNKALGDLVLYNFSTNTWESWDLSPAPV